MTNTLTELAETTTEPVNGRERNVFDRCERCNAESFIVFTKTDNGKDIELPGCRHHGLEWETKMLLTGWVMWDYTHLLNERPSVSANAD